MRTQIESKNSPRRLPAAVLGLAGTAVTAALLLALSPSAQAQFWSPFSFGPPRRPPAAVPQQQQQQQYNQQYNPFGGFFGQPEQHREAPVDYSHAPAPQARHTDTPPTTPVVVLGDAMADWLASGLEDAFSDDADISIVRKPRFNAGLIRFDPRKENDWPQTIREIIAQEKPKFIVMMIGINDHQIIRDRVVPPGKPAGNSPAARPGTQPAQPAAAPVGADLASGENPPPNADQGNQDQPALVAPASSPSGPFEFHTDQWEAAYIKRIDAAIVAMKSAGVPVIWVGLPAQRGPKATTDASYLNDLYRGRAERAGVTYVDVWDGFVDEQGRYSPQGPDFEGQTRRLRSGDGVYFTKAGARKLAHYVEREIERGIANRALPVALPVEPTTPGGKPLPGSTARPLAGPVIPLTASTSGADELAGGARPAARPLTSDPLAARVLTKGEPIPAPSGRADDFSWPRGSGSATAVNANPSSQPAVTTTGLTTVPDPPSGTSTPPTTSKGGKPAPAAASASQRADLDGAAADDKSKPAAKKPPQRPQDTPPRPPAGIGPFGLFR